MFANRVHLIEIRFEQIQINQQIIEESNFANTNDCQKKNANPIIIRILLHKINQLHAIRNKVADEGFAEDQK